MMMMMMYEFQLNKRFIFFQSNNLKHKKNGEIDCQFLRKYEIDNVEKKVFKL